MHRLISSLAKENHEASPDVGMEEVVGLQPERVGAYARDIAENFNYADADADGTSSAASQ